MGNSGTWRLGHRPALDGVRGLAVALVIVGHLALPGYRGGGFVGVTAFFVLSGFLITTLLLQEREATGRTSLGAFYRRRGARLLPALAVLVAAVALAGLVTARDVILTALYVGNWARIDGGDIGYLSHTWSLAIEEQFYLIWPLLIIACRGRRAPVAAVAAVGLVASLASRILLWHGGAGDSRVYFGTDTRADALLLGCLLAAGMTARPEGRGRPQLAVTMVALMAALAAVGDGMAAYVWSPTVAAGATAVLIWASAQGRGTWLLTNPLAVYVGRRSYALYLWHIPLIQLTWDYLPTTLTPVVSLAARCAAVLAALVVSEASWRLVEAPAQRWLRKPVESSEVADRQGVPAGSGAPSPGS